MNRKIKIISWSLYDFGNTIFSMNIVSMYFALWIVVDKGGKDIFYSMALSISTFFIVLLMPILGVISDDYKRRMPFLIFFTVLCVIFTGLIGIFNDIFLGLLFFGIANFFYHTSLVFYDALIPQIAGSPDKIGKVSGYGVAFGYLGAILGLLMVKPFVEAYGRSGAFIPTAVMFLIFSLPLFFLIKDTEKQKISFSGINAKLIPAIKKLIQPFKEIRAYESVFMFLLANFLYCDTINTIIAFMAIYASKVIGFSNVGLINFFILSTVSAIITSYFWGLLTDKIGAKESLTLVLITWCIALLLAILSFKDTIFWIVGVISGAALAGVWVTSRVLIVKLSPPDKLGQFLGFYGLTEKVSAIVGPLIWGLAVLVFEPLGIIRYRIAVGILMVFILASIFILQKVNYEKDS
ncbi:MAG: MFS transporter [Elusimicrobia bacterium]|nr:MFS transporter [Elusimicrobiota bacterium]